MKIFETDTNAMVDLMYLLGSHYMSVFVTKPKTSRPCNSERYLVCKDFRGISDERLNELFTALDNYNKIVQENPNVVINGLFTIPKIEGRPLMFREIIAENNKKYYKGQCEALEVALAFAKNTRRVEKPRDMSYKWMKKYYLD